MTVDKTVDRDTSYGVCCAFALVCELGAIREHDCDVLYAAVLEVSVQLSKVAIIEEVIHIPVVKRNNARLVHLYRSGERRAVKGFRLAAEVAGSVCPKHLIRTDCDSDANCSLNLGDVVLLICEIEMVIHIKILLVSHALPRTM